MAFRYRQRYFDTDDALNIEDWNQNIKELVEEFNGYLDRDNFQNGSFGQAQIVGNAFTKVHFDDSGAGETIDVTTVAWQHGSLCELDIVVAVDCLLLVELGAQNVWSATIADNYVVRHRVTVDGVAVAESGWYSAKHQSSCIWINGAAAVSAGKHLIEHWVSVAEIDLTDDSAWFAADPAPGLSIRDRQLLVIERRR